MLGRSSPSSAPGLEAMPYSVWKRLHKLFPDILPDLTNPLVQRGYHPVSLKKAEGMVLDKPGKPSYDAPATYRVIVLLDTPLKIVERLIANRLSAQTRELGPIHRNQCSSLLSVSSFHAAVSLTHEVAIAQKLKLKAFSLFLDIKSYFDNIRPTQLRLTGPLRERGVSPYIASWIKSFLSRRTCRLKFEGSRGDFKRVAVGTPQGSPISPLLFVLYVASFHRGLNRQNTFSFINDFVLTSMSLSHRRNIQILQTRFRALSCRAKRLRLSFSILKTELIDSGTRKDRSPQGLTPVHLDSEVFYPKEEVRWLGY